MSTFPFNLYVNDIFQVINDSPLLLSEYDPINVLMYADDLIVLAKSEEELQKKMNTINAEKAVHQ